LSRVLLRKLIITQPAKKFPLFRETDTSLPCSQDPATDSFLNTVDPNHRLLSYSPTIHYCIKFPYTAMPSKWSLPYKFSDRNVLSLPHLPIRATCPPHVTLLHLIVLIIFGEAWILRMFSYVLLQPPITFSFLGSNTSIRPMYSRALNLCYFNL